MRVKIDGFTERPLWTPFSLLRFFCSSEKKGLIQKAFLNTKKALNKPLKLSLERKGH